MLTIEFRNQSWQKTLKTRVALTSSRPAVKYCKMADVSGQTILNEAALKRLDPYVKKLLDTAKFVALYTFKLKENKWEKTGVEGSLFVYSRTGEPFYNILVLNRLNTNNLIEPISSKLILQLHEPFLLYLNSKCCLYGIWFYEKEECTRLASLIEKLVKELSNTRQYSNNVRSSCRTGVDICYMLTRAQEVYSSKVNGNEIAVEDGKNEQDADQTPQSVMEFFAKAGSAPKATILPSPPVRPASVECESGEKSPVNPLIHQLMSNPVHLVEHIEKQQRMVTPQADEVPSSKIVKSLISATENGKNGKENSSVSPKVSPSLSAFFSLLDGAKSNSTLLPTENGTKETPRKPALMPPAMFTPPTQKDNGDDFKLEPLTRNQLYQAISYLLKTDPVFITKIHEAYVKSLTDRVL